jgi:hypothetical protein
MALHNCLKGLNSALAALLSEPAPGDTVTPGLTQRYDAVIAAVNSCTNLQWPQQAAKSMMQKQVSTVDLQRRTHPCMCQTDRCLLTGQQYSSDHYAHVYQH